MVSDSHHQCCGATRSAIEYPVEAALLSTNGRVTFGGMDVSAVADMSPGDAMSGPVVMLVGKAGGEVRRVYGGQLDAMRVKARAMAAETGEPVALVETVKSGERDDQTIAVLATRYLYEPHNREALIDAAHESFPEALRLLSMGAAQKKLDPLDPRFFDKLAASMSNYMARDFTRVSAPVFDKWINNIINTNWAGATDAELALVTRKFNAAFREIGGKHWLGIRGQIYHRTGGFGQSVKRATVKRYDLAISPNLALKDAAAIRQITASHAHYVTDAMGNIATASSQQATKIVRNGLAKGLGSREIGQDLFDALGKSLAGRTRNYFDVAASAMLNRSQTYSKAVTYSEAGVEKVLWDSVLDELTSRVCRFSDSKVFAVKAILGHFDKTAALSDPRDIRFTQPWMRERTIKDGEFKGLKGLFLRQRDGSDRMVAAELTSGMGKVNDRGTWHEAMDIETLQDMGYSAPPGHPSCRSSLVADVIPPKTRTRRVNVPAPRSRKPIIDPMGNKGPVSSVTANRGLTYYDGLRVLQAQEAVAAGSKPLSISKYDKVIGFSERYAVPPVFSTPRGLGLELGSGFAAARIRAIMLAAVPQSSAEIREVRLSTKIKPKDALAKVDYSETSRVLTISKEAAKDVTEVGKYTTGKQLAYALELERRRAMHKDKKITKEDREAARQADLITGAGTLFDPVALEDVN